MINKEINATKIILNIFPYLIFLIISIVSSIHILDLSKTLLHPDIYSHYYPFRQWFSESLKLGEFPLWNPYWGIGQIAVEWTTIPLDMFTIFEIFLGDHYHYYLVIQIFLLLSSIYFTFRGLKFSKIVCIFSSLAFLSMPLIAYWAYYFIVFPSFIAHILLFYFTFKWFEEKKLIFLFAIVFSTFIGMLGTRIEFWYFEIQYYFFLLIFLFFNSPGKNKDKFRLLFLSLSSFIVGILCNSWQFPILIPAVRLSGRVSVENISFYEILNKIFISLYNSGLFLGFLFILFIALGIKFYINHIKFINLKKLSILSIGFIIILFAYLYWIYFFILDQLISNFLFKILFIIIFLAINFVILLCKDVKSSIIFSFMSCPLIYYFTKSFPGELGEMEIMYTAPSSLLFLIYFFSLLGILSARRSLLALLAWASILFVLIMRDQGQIILSHLFGLLWHPTRDNYLIDLNIIILACFGISTSQGRMLNSSKAILRSLNNIQFLACCLCIYFFSLLSSGYLYRIHSLVQNSPKDYPFYQGIKSLDLIYKYIESDKLSRLYIVNYDAYGFTYGFGNSLLGKVGQVALYDSLVPKNWKDWTIYQNLGISPTAKWSGYPNGFSENRIRTLPYRDLLGKKNEIFYHFNLITRPSINKSLFRFLGVKYLLFINPITGHGFAEWHQPSEVQEMVDNLNPVKIITIDSLAHDGVKANHYLAILEDPLPRAFLLEGATLDAHLKLASEITPHIKNNYLYLGHEQFPIKKVTINTYKPEYVKLEVSNPKGGILIFTDLSHPNWSVNIDGKLGDINQAYGIVRSVFISPGTHVVEFKYSAPWLYEATILSILVILAFLIYFLFFKRKYNN